MLSRVCAVHFRSISSQRHLLSLYPICVCSHYVYDDLSCYLFILSVVGVSVEDVDVAVAQMKGGGAKVATEEVSIIMH